MTDEELEVFYKLDTKKYLIKYNRTIKEMLKKLEMMMCLDDVQAFIDKLTSWYNIKYSDRYIELILKNDNTMVDTTLVDVMNLQRLQQNFNTLENNIFMDQSKEMVIFRKYLVQMAGCKLIYSQYSSPYLGYYRAQKLFEDFNLFFDWNLDFHVFDIFFERDYSSASEIVSNKIKQEEKKAEKEETKSMKKSLIRSRLLFRR